MTKPLSAEIPKTDEQRAEVWFGHKERSNEKWMIIVFFKAMTLAPPGGRIYSGEKHIGVITADGQDLIYPAGCIKMETKHILVIDGFIFDGHGSLEDCKAAAKKACEGYGENCIGCSLPFRGCYPLCVPDTMEELQDQGMN